MKKKTNSEKLKESLKIEKTENENFEDKEMKLDLVTSLMICNKCTKEKGGQVENRSSYQVKIEIIDLMKL